MSSVVAGILGLPPGVHFQPDDDELVEYYLLPRARGEPVPFAGVAVVDNDAAGSTLPWDLLDRHGRGADNGAYFFVRGSGDGEAAKPGAREERGCGGGGGTWKSQKRHLHTSLRVAAGEKVGWSRHNLNLHMGRGKSGGSVGWVMHEYALTDDPSCPSLKICHVAFTGHGKNRKRVPGGGGEDRQSEPVSKRARVDAAASGGSGSTTTTVEQDYSGVWRAYADHVGPAQVTLTGQDGSECRDMFFGNELRDMLFSAPPDAQPCSFEEYVPAAAAATTEQQVLEHAMMMPLPMVQQNAGMAGFEQQQYPCGQDDDDDHKQFLASFGITLDQLCDMTGIGDWEGL